MANHKEHKMGLTKRGTKVGLPRGAQNRTYRNMHKGGHTERGTKRLTERGTREGLLKPMA